MQHIRQVLSRSLRCAAAALVALVALAPPLQAAQDGAVLPAYKLGIFPYLSPRQTVELFGPVAASMEAALQHPVRLESVPSMPDFARAVADRRYDLVLVQPFDYLETVEKHGYLPLAQLSVPLVSRFFVRDDSRYRTIQDLRGSTVAMPPAQTASARMTLRALHDHGLIPGRDLELRYFSSHDDCILQVWAGAASACGTAGPPIRIFEQRMQAKLRAIHDTPALPHLAIVAHPRVPAAQRDRLQALIIGWNQTASGRAMLQNLGLTGFVAPRPADYEVLRGYPAADAVVHAARLLGKDLVLGVLPYLAPRQLAHNFAPALPALSRVSGLPVQFRSSSNFDTFAEALRRETFDLALLQPFDYAEAARHGYLPLAAMAGRVHGEFFVLEDSPFRRIADLRGHMLAMPPAASGFDRLGRQSLAAAGLTPGSDVQIDQRRSHDSCLQQVQRRVAAACVTSAYMRSLLPAEQARSLRSIGRTAEIPGLVFMVHERVPPAMRERIGAEIRGWKGSAGGRVILESIGVGELDAVDVEAYRHLPKLEGAR